MSQFVTTMGSRAAGRRGMTFIEVTIASLIGMTVMGVAFLFYQHTTGMSNRTAQLSTSTQAAAQFFYALEQDIANLVPKSKSYECFAVFDADTDASGTEPGTRSFEFQRMNPDKAEQVDWDGFRVNQKKENVQVRYEARKKPELDNMFQLSRIVFHSDTDARTTVFRGAYAKEVRFTKVQNPIRFADPTPGADGEWFLRVTMLLVGDHVNAELKSSQQAPVVPISMLYKMTVNVGADNLDDPFKNL